jgi:hypothetical protein
MTNIPPIITCGRINRDGIPAHGVINSNGKYAGNEKA